MKTITYYTGKKYSELRYEYEKEDERQPFHLDLGFYNASMEEVYPREFLNPSYRKKIIFQNEGELSRLLKMFDIRNLAYFDVPVDDDDLDIFEIDLSELENVLKQRSNPEPSRHAMFISATDCKVLYPEQA
uniref:DUF3110 domain-containing protein n=1 Tax=Strongyloides venezuelensis TaxID=75913 RepID=A0A0K0F625_STRVS